MTSSKPHVLIIGAGITGLLLAQALRKNGISYSIYERDPEATSRGFGWGLAIHWAKLDLIGLLPEELQDGWLKASVDAHATVPGQSGRFPFFDLSTGQKRFSIESTERVRLSRKGLRDLLATDLMINWAKEFESVDQDSDGDLTVRFSDGTSTAGTHLAGCDGAKSMVSRVLRAPCMERVPKSNNIALDARFLGASVAVSHDTAKTLQQMDPVFFQAAHPNGTFLFCALLAYPENSDDKYVYQVNISWPYKRGFLGRDDPIEVPKMQEERHFLMREMANYWEPPFRDIIDSMPGSLELQEIKLEYRIPEQNSWNNMKGRATLIGDAAHPMPPYRGEACNHAIKDVVQFVTCYSMVLNPLSECPDSGSACFKYEKEMILRTQEAVLASVLACKHAHDYRSIDAKSPLVSARAVVALRDVQSMLDGPPLMRPLTSFKAIS